MKDNVLAGACLAEGKRTFKKSWNQGMVENKVNNTKVDIVADGNAHMCFAC